MRTAAKVISTIIKIILILAIIAGIVLSIFFSKETKTADIEIPNTRPTFDNTIDSSQINGKTDLEKAIYLYELANRNYISCDKSAYFVNATNNMAFKLGKISMPMLSVLYIYSVRTQDDYQRTEYSIPSGGITAAIPVKEENTNYAMRAYQDLNMNYLYAQKALHPTIKDVVDNEGNPVMDEITGQQKTKIEVDWSEKNIVDASKWNVEQEKEIFSKKQNETYYQTKLTINKNTIKEVSIEFIETTAGNYYEIKITLNPDVEETYAKNIANLKEGAGDDAHYISMYETIQIWDNGYYKSFRSLDTWAAMSDSLESEMNYYYTFYYQEEANDISTFLEDGKTPAKAYIASK